MWSMKYWTNIKTPIFQVTNTWFRSECTNNWWILPYKCILILDLLNTLLQRRGRSHSHNHDVHDSNLMPATYIDKIIGNQRRMTELCNNNTQFRGFLSTKWYASVACMHGAPSKLITGLRKEGSNRMLRHACQWKEKINLESHIPIVLLH